MTSLRSHLWPVACIAVALVYILTVPHTWQCEGADEIEYLSLAHSMVRGYGYTIYGAPHVLYPPLFASILSVVMRVFGIHAWRAMYTLNALLGVSGLILVGTWLRTRFGWAGRWAAWFMLFSYYPWSFSCRFLMTEPLFLPLSFTALVLAWRILARNEGRYWEYGVLGVLCLLGAMTRAAAVSLNLALVAAGGVRWITTRRRAGLAVALLALFLGVGFFAYWSARADIVDPQAVESHWRWAKRYLGMSTEEEGIIATGEEVTEISSVFHRRLIFAAMRFGQFILSVVRPPDAFLPLAALLSILFCAGLIGHWRKNAWSPLAWYTAVFLAMILNTTWLSNYLRFYLVLAPFLFLFLFEGLELTFVGRSSGPSSSLSSRNGRRGAPSYVFFLAAWAVWGLIRVFSGVSGYGPGAKEQLYMTVVQVFAGVLYGLVLFLTGWIVLRFYREGRVSARWLRSSRGGLDQVLALFLAMAMVHAGVLAFYRASKTRENAALEARGLSGLVKCATWLRDHAPADATGVATIPRMVSFLSDRIISYPSYRSGYNIDLDEGAYVVLSGELVEVAPYRWYREYQLLYYAERIAERGELSQVNAADNARVFRKVDSGD